MTDDPLRQALVRRANNVAETLMAQAPMDEARGTLTSETVAALEKAGSFRLKLPAVLGGDEADPVAQILVLEAALVQTLRVPTLGQPMVREWGDGQLRGIG
jgi:hypothetical protein